MQEREHEYLIQEREQNNGEKFGQQRLSLSLSLHDMEHGLDDILEHSEGDEEKREDCAYVEYDGGCQ